MREASDKSQEHKPDPVDSAPLRLDQLSDHELGVILQIERRIKDVQATVSDSTTTLSPRPYLAPAYKRHRRVLLLDGSRGTGKTSLLLTMIHRWDPENASQMEAHDAERERYCKKVKSIGETDCEIPKNILVVGRLLDFDPLPPAVPLLASIVQAWRPIAETFDEELGGVRYERQNEEEGTLLDLWHSLFRVAAVGWTELPPSQGLIEQVLDQEEQVKDWHSLDTRWTRFLNQLVKSGQRYTSEAHRLSKDTVFVIMIDDVDLQVHRIRQLLPALRLLYHERVVFLVAADLEHMEHMLCADFHGQQNRLARHQNATDTALADIMDADPWSLELARSSIEKVFARRNRWGLKKLSLLQFLAFPEGVSDLLNNKTAERTGESSDTKPKNSQEDNGARSPSEVPAGMFLEDLQAVPYPNWKDKSSLPKRRGAEQGDKQKGVKPTNQQAPGKKGTGARILSFARDADLFGLGGVMTYRTAVQLSEHVQALDLGGERRGMEVLAQVISGSGEEELASVLSDNSIYLPVKGELAALHRPGPTIPAGTHSLVLSARPDFVFLPSGPKLPIHMSSDRGRHFNYTGLLLAKMLEELGYPVDASGLLWNTFVSHAWTEWELGGHLMFAWPRPFHPRPEEHLDQVRMWRSFVDQQRVQQTDETKIEKWAYAWVYYQRVWSGHQLKEDLEPEKAFESLHGLPWSELCKISETDRKGGPSGEHKWKEDTLLLLARPELGFPAAVQDILLNNLRPSDTEALKRERRRLITDAFVAGDIQRGGTGRDWPDEKETEGIVNKIDERYSDVHSVNPWRDRIEEGNSQRK